MVGRVAQLARVPSRPHPAFQIPCGYACVCVHICLVGGEWARGVVLLEEGDLVGWAVLSLEP